MQRRLFSGASGRAGTIQLSWRWSSVPQLTAYCDALRMIAVRILTKSPVPQIGGILPVMNVRDMNVGAEPLSQIFRCLNGLNGYGREIDKHQDISKVHFFHGDKIDQERAINLSLLAKDNSFLAHNRNS